MPRVAGWPPRWLSPTPQAALAASRAPETIEFINTFCRVTKDSQGGRAGDLIVLRAWQKILLRHLYACNAAGRLRHRRALIGMARKNAKSTLGAALALEHIIFGPAGSEAYSCAGDREQARIVFGTARRMVELEPELGPRLKLYRDVIEHRATGSIYKVLSAEAYTKEGLNPSLVIFDEVHVQTSRELWDVMALAAGARVDPLMIGITTAGARFDSRGYDTLCYGLYQYGKRVATGEVVDPAFFFAWWEPRDEQADHANPKVWPQGNPGYGDIVSAEDFRSAVRMTPEPEFRTKRCNQWVAAHTAWFGSGMWEACELGGAVPDDAEVCLGFDGSFSQDSTALIVATCEPVPHIDVVASWEKPATEGADWRVPIADVEETIRRACTRWRVREVVCDPYGYRHSAQILMSEGIPWLEYPQTPARMNPATHRFYEAVTNGGLTHSGDPRLARHIANCVLKTDGRGSRIIKETRASARKIDLAVAAVMAFDRAATREPSYNLLESVL